MGAKDPPVGAAAELPEQLVSQLLDVAKGLDGQASSAAEPIAGEQPALPPPPPPPIDWQAEAREVVELATEGFFPLYPRLAEVWTPAKLERFTLRLSAVMQKYDLTLGKILGKWGPEIMLAAVTVPAVVPTYRVIRDTNQELREKAKLERGARPQPAAAAAAAPSAPTGPASSPKAPAEFSGPKPPPDTLNLAARV